jgi:hypothetical protein
MFIFSTALGITGSFSSEGTGKAALAMLILWVVAYSWSAAPIGFIAGGETSTPRLRAQTSAVAFASQSLCLWVPISSSMPTGLLAHKHHEHCNGVVERITLVAWS